MKIQILSDLHNEISPFDPIKTDADVVVLAGDIGRKEEGVRWAMHAFPGKHVVYLPGNHEFYYGQRVQISYQIKHEAAGVSSWAVNCGAGTSKIHLLDDSEIIIGDVRFLGCTLWTDFELFGAEDKPFAVNEASLYLSDFRHILNGETYDRFTPEDSIVLHQWSLNWLQTKLAEPFDGKTVVVTHHLPSMLSVSDRFKDSTLSACFASNLDHLFGKMDLWIHGHTHDSVDYVANGTRVVCNPRGYALRNGSNENADFDPVFTVEV
jgi:predicted phosphodiesterase